MRKRGQRGQGLVEFAIILPLLCGIMLMIVVIGDIFRRIELIENAASEAGRAAQVWRPDGVNTCYSTAVAGAQRITPLPIDVAVSGNCGNDYWTRIPSGTLITVQVTHTFEPIFFSTLLIGRDLGDPPFILSYTATVEDSHE